MCSRVLCWIESNLSSADIDAGVVDGHAVQGECGGASNVFGALRQVVERKRRVHLALGHLDITNRPDDVTGVDDAL